MKETKLRRRAGILLAAAMLLAALTPQIGALKNVPDALVLRAGGVASVEVGLPLSLEVQQDGVVRVDRRESALVDLTAGESSGTAQVVFRLLGLLPVKTMTVTVEQPKMLVPGGRSLGVALRSEGVVVVGSSDLGNRPSPARAAGVRAGDVILSVDGAQVESAQSLSANLTGSAAHLEILRDGETRAIDVTPEIDPRDGAYRLGVWVRESTAGVGTMTFYDPETNRYGALGHAITDVDTGVVFPVGEGAVYENTVVEITRGREGAPGALTGEFFEDEVLLGEIDRNTPCGVFGNASDALAQGEAIPVGTRDEIRIGEAHLITTVDSGAPRAYSCMIEKVYPQSASKTRSLVLRVTDPDLLEKTGGIVQGMSGSPIIQDGKLIGAVTHVLVNDPTTGYGIFIENMLEAAE